MSGLAASIFRNVRRLLLMRILCNREVCSIAPFLRAAMKGAFILQTAGRAANVPELGIP